MKPLPPCVGGKGEGFCLVGDCHRHPSLDSSSIIRYRVLHSLSAESSVANLLPTSYLINHKEQTEISQKSKNDVDN